MDTVSFENAVNGIFHQALDDPVYKDMFDSIKLGIQRADHVVFEKIKDTIPDHLGPYDFCALNNWPPDKGDASVVSIAVYFKKCIVEENSRQQTHPSHSWYQVIYHLENFIKYFSTQISCYVDSMKHSAIFPKETALYKVYRENNIKYANWSERHVAYACGLGSFGLHGALITDRGCTHHLMSFIVNTGFGAYSIPQELYYENCLYLNEHTCGKCMTRCPVNSITEKGHCVRTCLGHESVVNKKRAKEIYGIEIEACGLCMSGVPCSLRNPRLK